MWIDKDGNPSPGWIIVNVAQEGEPELWVRIFAPTDEQYIANGWTWQEPPAPEPTKPRYSKRKIILALGAEAWEEKKAELEAAGVYEIFTQSTYLCADDPTFAAVYEHLTAEEKRILNEECLYDD